jgi:hypothetical protein
MDMHRFVSWGTCSKTEFLWVNLGLHTWRLQQQDTDQLREYLASMWKQLSDYEYGAEGEEDDLVQRIEPVVCAARGKVCVFWCIYVCVYVYARIDVSMIPTQLYGVCMHLSVHERVKLYTYACVRTICSQLERALDVRNAADRRALGGGMALLILQVLQMKHMQNHSESYIILCV